MLDQVVLQFGAQIGVALVIVAVSLRLAREMRAGAVDLGARVGRLEERVADLAGKVEALVQRRRP
jgi:hypothetical protein